MAQSFSFHGAAFLVCSAAAAFCFWAGNGTSHDLCFTAGCRLFEDVSVAGISLYTVGVSGFGLLALLALTGRLSAGKVLSALALVLDLFLLTVMIFTAPCINCLIIAAFVLAAYACFRMRARTESGYASPSATGKRGILPLLWCALFFVNVLGVAKEQLSVWAITDNAEHASISVYFSPSCSACRQAITRLSGHVDVAFFPVAEDETDIARIAAMQKSLADGASITQALAASSLVQTPSPLSQLSPGMLLLRFRLLRNMAHVYSAGSDKIPFIEYHGLPAFLAAPAGDSRPAAADRQPRQRMQVPLTSENDESLPVETGVWGACSAGSHYEESESFSRPTRRTKQQ